MIQESPKCPYCKEYLKPAKLLTTEKELYTVYECPNKDYKAKALSGIISTKENNFNACDDFWVIKIITSAKELLIDLIKKNSFTQNKETLYKLSSGLESYYYFNLKKTTLSPLGQFLIGNLVLNQIEHLHPTAIGGLTLGADAIATAVAYTSYMRSLKFPPYTEIQAIIIRKNPKNHGTMLSIEGNVAKNDTIVIVDDVITTGKATIKAIELAEQENLKILAIIPLIDRCEANGRQNIEKYGYPVIPLLTISDFL